MIGGVHDADYNHYDCDNHNDDHNFDHNEICILIVILAQNLFTRQHNHKPALNFTDCI